MVPSLLIPLACLYGNLMLMWLKRLHVVAPVQTGCPRLSLLTTVVGCRLNIPCMVRRTRLWAMLTLALNALMPIDIGLFMLTVQVIRSLIWRVSFVVMTPPVI